MVMLVRPFSRYGIELSRSAIRRPNDQSPTTFACPGCDLVFNDGVAYSTCPACDLPLDWVDLGQPVWCCASCDRMINADVERAPYCDRCGRNMTRVASPAWPFVPALTVGVRRKRFPTLSMVLDRVGSAMKPVGALVLRILLHGLLAVVLFGPVLTMAIDPRWRLLAMATLAPLLLVPLILGGAVIWNGELGELRVLAHDRPTRVIHGLEHATAKVLSERGLEPDGGITHDGYFRLNFSAHRSAVFDEAETVHAAAREAITRVIRGETDLAFHPQCGTSQLVAIALLSLMAVVSTAVALFFTVDGKVLVVGLTGFSLLAVGARRLGILVQRLLTVSTEFHSARVVRVVRNMTGDGNLVRYDVFLDVNVG